MRTLRLRKFKPSIFKDYFGLITVGTFTLGYIGFYTYTARYSLPFVHPEVSQVVAIGIASWLTLVAFYLASGGKIKRKASSIQSSILFIILSIIVNQLNPIYLFFGVFIYMDSFEETFFSTRPISFKKKRTLIVNKRRVNRLWNIGIALAFMAIGIFWNLQTFMEWIFIHIAVQVFRLLRFNITGGYRIFLIVILTPIFLFGLFMADKDFTLFGLSNPSVTMTKKDGSKVKGRLLFKDADFFYLEDTVTRFRPNTLAPFAPEIKTSINIAKNEIIEYRVDTATNKMNLQKSGIQYFRRDFK